ncbi:hypothetical protein OG352_24870 [Streptomyces sp. NBC_01485]|uniref:hypothetical protein n=1 Tax=Streptomyces sp. NBC_01485 TaxID=2903884 RepID=UPI002E34979A|nr:hypothetical protein [Streptomyces sp. NBC_01485]
MPRGRHRHSPPLHRLLPPSAIAGVSLVCALGPWVFTEPMVLRGLAAAAAATAIVGAVVMRHWDIQAGKRVADLTRARAGDEWHHEERVAELESDLEESRELRAKLEQRLRSKRTELAGLRNEHAALLRRYATAETERASALEGRRLLEIEAVPSPALPAARAAGDAESTKSTRSTGAVAKRAIEAGASSDAVEAAAEAEETVEPVDSAEAEPKVPAAFSPEGSRLFLRAQAALARFDTDGVKASGSDGSAEKQPAQATSVEAGAAAGGETEAAQEDEAQGKPEAAGEHTRAAALNLAENLADENEAIAVVATIVEQDAPEGAPAQANDADDADDASGLDDANGVVGAEALRPEPLLDPVPAAATATPGPAPAAEVGAALVRRPAAPVQRPSGHFAVPTAVAVVPAAEPVWRPTAEGGFDFFGTQSESALDALEAVQNEDLADVVGQEALALHKAESEAKFKRVDEASRGVGQVIDLTAHDETAQIDLQSLRSAVS